MYYILSYWLIVYFPFFVEFKIYISLKHNKLQLLLLQVSQNSKFTYLSNITNFSCYFFKFRRIQNLHISQTTKEVLATELGFVEFKIYISLKLCCKFLLLLEVLQNSKFTYLSNIPKRLEKEAWFCRIQNLHISQTITFFLFVFQKFCRIQNLHISQTLHSMVRA